MNIRRVSGIILLIIGIVMYFFANYIADQVTAGKEQISSAQSKVDAGNTLFSLNPYSKQIGKAVVTDPAQQQINEGKQQVSQYDQISHWLHTGGIVVMIIGAGLIIISFIGKRKH